MSISLELKKDHYQPTAQTPHAPVGSLGPRAVTLQDGPTNSPSPLYLDSSEQPDEALPGLTPEQLSHLEGLQDAVNQEKRTGTFEPVALHGQEPPVPSKGFFARLCSCLDVTPTPSEDTSLNSSQKASYVNDRLHDTGLT